MGDGELNEGQVWESIATISHNKLNNIIAIVDRNGIQLSGETDKIKNLNNIEKKFEAFGWFTLTCDGSSIYEISKCLNTCSLITDRPKAVICDTSMLLKKGVM
jgi:Transketolase, N-terminal subunit